MESIIKFCKNSPFVKKHSAFIEQEWNQKSECLLNQVGLFVSLTRFICLMDRICLYVQGLPNLIGRWLPSGLPRIATWLPNNDWW